MKNIVIVYHSDKGHTKAIANSIANGIESYELCNVSVLSTESVDKNWEVLDKADSIVFGSPTYMGNVSAQFKGFMDSTSGRWYKRSWVNKVAAGFTTSGSLSGDKSSTLSSLSVFAAQHGMIWIGPEEICESTTPNNQTVNRLGCNIGLMSQADPYQDIETSIPEGDIKTAFLFGERIAKVTHAFTLQKTAEAEECLA